MKVTKQNKTTSAAIRQQTASTPRQKQDTTTPFQFADNRPEARFQRNIQASSENRTGLPDRLKIGIENLSGYSLDDVKVHYNSARPASIHAHAYAQGTDIHLAQGQERYLPHEAWHVVQQKQGRVRPTMQLKAGVNINDDAGLEKEADVMGTQALRAVHVSAGTYKRPAVGHPGTTKNVMQGRFTINGDLKSLEEVIDWYGTFPISENNKKGNKDLPSWVLPILKYYEKGDYDYEIGDKNTQVKFLEEFIGLRPTVHVNGRKRARPGVIDESDISAMEQWDLGEQQAHAPSVRNAEITVLAHNTHHHDYFHKKAVNPSHGSNPGEFGLGFYLTTGHETESQVKIRDKWASDKGAPNDVIKFHLRNTDIQRNFLGYPEEMSGEQTEALTLVVFMLQHSTGYPEGMGEDAAITIMNRVNEEGRVLLFPMDKEKIVHIDSETEQNWQNYTENNAGGSSHFLVIGPQRPPELEGIRQIAVRGDVGDLEINRAARSFEKMKIPPL